MKYQFIVTTLDGKEHISTVEDYTDGEFESVCKIITNLSEIKYFSMGVGDNLTEFFNPKNIVSITIKEVK